MSRLLRMSDVHFTRHPPDRIDSDLFKVMREPPLCGEPWAERWLA